MLLRITDPYDWADDVSTVWALLFNAGFTYNQKLGKWEAPATPEREALIAQLGYVFCGYSA